MVILNSLFFLHELDKMSGPESVACAEERNKNDKCDLFVQYLSNGDITSL